MTQRRWIAAGAAVVVLAAGAVAAAAIAGSQVKSRLQAMPQAWQAQWPMLKVLDHRYQRGLFSATQTITLQWGCESAGAAGMPGTLTVVQHIQHGPLPGLRSVGLAAVDTELVLSDAARRQALSLTGDASPLHVHTVIGFSGATHGRVHMPAFESKGPEGTQLSFQGLEAEWHDDGRQLRYDASLPGFSVSAHDDRLAMQTKLSGAHVRGEFAGSGSLWSRPGRMEGELGAFEMSMAPASGPVPPMRIGLQKLKLVSENTLDKELLNSSGSVSGQGRFNDVMLDKIEVRSSVKRVHAARYERLLQHFMETSAAACDLKQSVSPQVMLAQMQEDIAALLPFNPEISLDRMAVESGGLRAELSYALSMEGVTAEDAALPLPALMMTKGRLRGRVQLPVAWVQGAVMRFAPTPPADAAASQDMAEVVLARLTNEGMVVREGDTLSAEFSLDKGQWLINGKPPADHTAH